MADVIAESEALHAKVRAYAREADAPGRAFDPAAFEALALEIARFQHQNVKPLARLYDAAPSALEEIRAAPAELFRLRRVAAHAPELDVRTFRTSGTTDALTGNHAMRSLTTYVENTVRLADRYLFAQSAPTNAVVLAPSSTAVPTSSLSFMIDEVLARRGLAAEHLVDTAFGLRKEEAVSSLRACTGPTVVFGTSFAFVYLLDHVGRDASLPLPRGSVLMLTGGYKGRTREVPEAKLREDLARLFDLAAENVVSEYGMTELTSQLYEPSLAHENPARGVVRPPPWLRVVASHPDTLAPLPPGEEGIAKMIDLGNIDSSVAVQTLDRVVVAANGDVTLLGRAKGAELRGCSLLIEQLTTARAGNP